MTPLRGARAITVVEWVVPLFPPVLFAVFPLFVLFAHNQTEVERAELWRPLAICVISAMALYGLFAIVFGNGPKAGALASLVVVAFYFYGSDARQVSGWGLGGGWFDALWLALLVLGVVALVRTTRTSLASTGRQSPSRTARTKPSVRGEGCVSICGS
jgi:hypothetical protein